MPGSDAITDNQKCVCSCVEELLFFQSLREQDLITDSMNMLQAEASSHGRHNSHYNEERLTLWLREAHFHKKNRRCQIHRVGRRDFVRSGEDPVAK